MHTKKNTSLRLFDQTDWTPDNRPAPQTPWQGDKPLTQEQLEEAFEKAFILEPLVFPQITSQVGGRK